MILNTKHCFLYYVYLTLPIFHYKLCTEKRHIAHCTLCIARLVLSGHSTVDMHGWRRPWWRPLFITLHAKLFTQQTTQHTSLNTSRRSVSTLNIGFTWLEKCTHLHRIHCTPHIAYYIVCWYLHIDLAFLKTLCLSATRVWDTGLPVKVYA